MWFADNVTLQTYGYNYLPLLLSLAAPPLSILLPNPLPPNASSSVADTKYPYASLRKSLRLLVEDPDPWERRCGLRPSASCNEAPDVVTGPDLWDQSTRPSC